MTFERSHRDKWSRKGRTKGHGGLHVATPSYKVIECSSCSLLGGFKSYLLYLSILSPLISYRNPQVMKCLQITAYLAIGVGYTNYCEIRCLMLSRSQIIVKSMTANNEGRSSIYFYFHGCGYKMGS